MIFAAIFVVPYRPAARERTHRLSEREKDTTTFASWGPSAPRLPIPEASDRHDSARRSAVAIPALPAPIEVGVFLIATVYPDASVRDPLVEAEEAQNATLTVSTDVRVDAGVMWPADLAAHGPQ
jgi:hypothetical protein